MDQRFFHKDVMLLVENAANARGEPEIPREFIVEAMCKIERGEEEVVLYPTGAPSLKGVYDIAARLLKNKG